MSAKLKPLDLTGAVVGTTGIIDFNQFVKFQANNLQEKAHLWLFNESGAGVDILFQQSNNSHFLPAGGWGTFEIDPIDSQVKATVSYVIPAPPVSLLAATYYAPGEKVPQAFTLGNSPIGGGTTTVGSTLSNETATVGTEIIDIGTVANNKLWDIFNDHFVAGVEQSGVRHQVLKGQTAGNPLQIGLAGDISEVLGALMLSQTPITITGTTSGTVKCYEILKGSNAPKFTLIVSNNLNTTGPFDIVLTSPYTVGAWIANGNTGGVTFKASGVAQSIDAVTGLASGGGSTSPVTTIQGKGMAYCKTGFDTLTYQSNASLGVLILFGV